jgi:CheY-like chemotaxis protein
VLVVDDEAAVLHMVREILEDEEFSVLTAGDGREALALALRSRPDLIITDLMMPVMNGRTLRERLRGERLTASIPVLLMSAAYRPQPGDDFAAVIGKPFDIDQLLSQVERHVHS